VVSDLSASARFQALASEIIAVLARRGLDVMPAVVNDVLEAGALRVAEQLGVTPLTALGYADPGTIATEIADAADHGLRGIRPLRDDRRTDLPAWTAGKLIAGLSQAVKYAAANGDTGGCGQAGDLLTELGLALLTSHGAQTITVASGCLIEAAELLDRVAERITAGEWSQCPCGTDHGQDLLDAKVAPAMRDDAAFARMVADRSPGDPEPTKSIRRHTGGHEGGLRLVE
jgi:hypothetical protein